MSGSHMRYDHMDQTDLSMGKSSNVSTKVRKHNAY